MNIRSQRGEFDERCSAGRVSCTEGARNAALMQSEQGKMQSKSTFRHAAFNAKLEAAPIEPSWVLEGQPQARNLVVAECGLFSTSVWDCSAGSFFWYYGINETVYILDGCAVITDMSGASRSLGPGDAALFAEGDWLHWHVPTYVRKFAVWAKPGKAIGRHLLGKYSGKARHIVSGRRRAGLSDDPKIVPAVPVAAAPGA